MGVKYGTIALVAGLVALGAVLAVRHMDKRGTSGQGLNYMSQQERFIAEQNAGLM